MEKERWKRIDKATKYEISDKGIVRRYRDHKVMATAIDRYGYEKIQLKYDNGYYLSHNEFSYKNFIVDLNIDTLIKKRKHYLSRPYIKRKHTYDLYNYFTGKTETFSTLDELTVRLNKVLMENDYVSKGTLSVAIGSSAKNKRNALIRGFGIRSSRHNFEWYPYTEEVILCNKNKVPYILKTYNVTGVNIDIIIFGLPALAKYFNISPHVLFKDITLEDLEASSNIPHINIRRLNKPIIIKNKI